MREELRRRLLLIYQMPKVGSQTVEASLQPCGLPHQIFRFHFLSATWRKTLLRGLKFQQANESWNRDARDQLFLATQLSKTIRMRKWLRLCGVNVPKIEVITGVRELIGLSLSSVFENHLFFVPDVESMTVEKCREALLHPKTLKFLAGWFDWELKRFLGVNVYATPFPWKRGYAIYENRFARVLLYRFEALGELGAMLSEFLGCEIPGTISRNVGHSKAYAQQYQYVKEHLRLPELFVRGQYSGKMMQHFYSEEERRHFLERWVTGEECVASAQHGTGK